MKSKIFRRLILLFLLAAMAYGVGRLYFHLTAGFTLANITSDFPFQQAWEVRPLKAAEQPEVDYALSQPYRYLGKGCQSYVFLSEDGRYVVKFFKYQRYRLQSWLAYFPPLPAIVKYRQEKIEKKWKKLDGFVRSWKLAFEELKDETGLLFVHLNKTSTLEHKLNFSDKVGLQYSVELDNMEFCIQRRATMLCDKLIEYRNDREDGKAKKLVDDLLAMVMGEYRRGLGDNDHALMQNTGVAEGKPVHIDVGQFVRNEHFKDPAFAAQELVTKTYKFKVWLKEHYPDLAHHLERKLEEIIGPTYHNMQPKFRPHH